MYRFWYRVRLLLTLILVIVVAGAIYSIITTRTTEDYSIRYNLQVTAAVGTAIQAALYDVTRTAEAPHQVFQIVLLQQNEDLKALAKRYGTTLEILQVVNKLASDVTTGNGETIIVPAGMQVLDPVRTIQVYIAQPGDTLNSIAINNSVSLDLLKRDNPVLTQRTLIPGDTVFIGFVL